MALEAFEPHRGLRLHFVDCGPGPLREPNERTDEPGPHCPLMVGGVTLPNTIFITTHVIGIARRKAPQPERCEQLARYYLDNLHAAYLVEA
jgi:hypothetical protein